MYEFINSGPFFPYSIHFKLYPLIVVNSMLSSCDIIILYCFFSHRKNNDDELVKNLLWCIQR